MSGIIFFLRKASSLDQALKMHCPAIVSNTGIFQTSYISIQFVKSFE